MIADRALEAISGHLAMCLYSAQTKIPDALKKNLWSIGWFDFTLNKTEPLYKLVIYNFLKILTKHHGLKHLCTQNVQSDKIRANIYQYDFVIDNKPFSCITVGNSNYPSHPLMALSDSILAYEVVNGCEQCGYTEEGCERCGFNKARKLLTADVNLRSFRSHGSNFWEAVGDERKKSLLDMGRQLNGNVARLMEDEDGDEDDDLLDPDDENFLGEPEEPEVLLIDEDEARELLTAVWNKIEEEEEEDEDEDEDD